MKKTEDLKSQVFVLVFQHKEKVQDVAKKLGFSKRYISRLKNSFK